MITGFNTDVQHRGRVFHVQTEEKGSANPIVVTLVYCGGQIVGALEAPYAAREDSREARAEIRGLMLEQHRARIRDVHAGRYDAQPSEEHAPSERSLDEVVLDYLDRSIDDARSKQARAMHTARVLDRLERMLSAAERAEAKFAAAAEPARLELRMTTLPSRRGPRARLALAALIASAAATPILVLVAPDPPPPAPIDLASRLPAAPPVESAPPVPALFGLEPAPVDWQPVEVEAAVEAVPAPVAPEAPALRTEAPRRRTSAPRPPRAARTIEPAAPAAPQATALAAEQAPVQVPLPAAEPTIENGDLVDLAAVDVHPLVRRRDLPRYTARARRAGLQGTVELALLIDERGEVADVMLVHDGAGGELADESLATVRGWTFSPARKDRQAVKVWQQVAIDFTILPNRSTSVRIRE